MKLLETILNTAMRLNTGVSYFNDLGYFKGLVDGYNMTNETDIIYDIDDGKVMMLQTGPFVYIWNESRRSFEWRAI